MENEVPWWRLSAVKVAMEPAGPRPLTASAEAYASVWDAALEAMETTMRSATIATNEAARALLR